MDDARFDAWARRLAERGSRRGFLGAVAGGLLAAVGLAAPALAEDGERRESIAAGRRCRRDADCAGCGACSKGRCVADRARCPDCKTCNPRTFRCEGGCGRGKVCCDGKCQVPGPRTCCTDSRQCGDEWGCLHCVNGRCRPKPDGRVCADCKRCKDGACTEADPNLLCDDVCCQSKDQVCVGQVFKECCDVGKACANDCCGQGEVCTREDGCCPQGRQCGAGSGGQFRFKRCCDADEVCVDGACCPLDRTCGDTCCPADHHCRDGNCCRECLEDGACCPRGSACINPDPFSENSCCDRSLNTPCGDNGDGTFKACCSTLTEACRNGECVPVQPCSDGRPPCGEMCCPAGQRCCNGTCKPDCDGRCCKPTERCKDGSCVPSSCPNYTDYCGKLPSAPDDEVCCLSGTCCFPGACCPPQVPKCCGAPPSTGFGICCPEDYHCCPGGGCCPPGDICGPDRCESP